MITKHVLILTIIMFLTLAACDSESSTIVPQKENSENNITHISISVGDSVFSAKLYDNETARDFVAKLPMTLNMSELNGNEKYYNLSNRLPVESVLVGSIKTGDLMLYGSDCLVLFYKSFSTSYSYTRLGYVEDVTGLAAALGSDSADVTFAISD